MSIFRKKSIQETLDLTQKEGHQLRRNLGPFDLAFLAVSVCVGAGIFSVSTKVMTQNAGPATILSFVIAAAVCGLAAMCYAEFSTSVPVSGSAYSYSYTTLGEIFAWIIGWDLILELFLAASVIAKYWAIYVADAFRVFGIDIVLSVNLGTLHIDYGAAIVVLFFTLLLSIGTRLSARITNAMTFIKIGIVFVIVVAGLAYFSWDNLTPFIPDAVPEGETATDILSSSLLGTLTGFGGGHFGVSGIFAGAAIICFAYVGFDTVATAAEETKNPRRNVPIGIILGLGIVTLLYVAVAFVTCGMVSYQDLSAFAAAQGSEVSLATAFLYHGAEWQSAVIAIGAAVGLTTVVMVTLFGTSRIVFAMSRDGLFPESWSKTSEKRQTPVGITVGLGVIAALVSSLTSVDELADMINIGTLSAFIMVSIGVLFMRKGAGAASASGAALGAAATAATGAADATADAAATGAAAGAAAATAAATGVTATAATAQQEDSSHSFRVPFFPVLPIVSAICCLLLMLNLTNITWLRFVVWLAVGFIIYFGYSRQHAKIRHDPKANGGD